MGDRSDPTKFDVVIAVYRETLEWLWLVRDLTRRVYVYSRVPDRTLSDMRVPEDMDNIHLEYLPNVGLEAAVYLHHMRKVRAANPDDDFGPRTLFAMGMTVSDQVRLDPRKWDTVAAAIGIGSTPHDHSPYGRTAAELASFAIDAHRSSNPQNREADFRCAPARVRPFGAWYDRYLAAHVRRPLSETELRRLAFHGAIFAIETSQIFRYDAALYEDLFDQCRSHRSPEVAHYLERSWKLMFDAL